MGDDRDTVQAAREAYARRDWTTAREGFRAVGELGTEDLASLADASWWLGLVEESLQLSEQVHQRHLDAGQTARAAMVAIEIGFNQLLRGQEAVGSGWLARARRLLADEPAAREHGYLLLVDASVALDGDDLDHAEDCAVRMQRLADAHGDVTLRSLGLFTAGQVAIRRGEVEDGLAALDEAMLPVRAGELTPEWAGNLHCQMMAVCHDLADLQRAREWTEATRRWCRGFEQAVMFTGICRVHRVQLLHAEGDWGRAEQEALEACHDLSDMNVGVVAEARYQLGDVYRLRGRFDAAEEAYRQAHALGRDPQPGLALLQLSQGRAEVAEAALEASLSVAADPLRRAPLLAARAAVALARERVGEAADAADELAAVATAHRSPGWQAAACQWQGAVLVARDRPAEAAPVLREAIRRWQDLGVPYETARARVDLAQADAGLGDHDGAARELDLAVDTFSRLGAARDLRRVGARRGHRGDRHGLTPREVEVVDAVAAGRTNREVAEHLHVSERTVARHLANVYLKAGVSSRTAAVAWARDRGLL